MRKQTTLWLSLLLVTILGTFYTQPLLAQEKTPDIAIETISGDDALVKGLTYYGTMNNWSEQTTLTLDRSGLLSSEVYHQTDVFHDYSESAVAAWQKDYRSFMRGKLPYQSNYAETDTTLYYVSVEEDGFSLAALDKGTGTTAKAALPYPATASNADHTITRTFSSGNRLIIQYALYNGLSEYVGSALAIYDPRTATLEDHLIFDFPEDFPGYQDVSVEPLTQAGKNALLVMVKMQETDWESTEAGTPVTSIVFQRYDLETKQLVDLVAGADFSEDNLPYAVQDSRFYQLHPSEGDWVIRILDAAQDKTMDELVLQNTASWQSAPDMGWKLIVSGNRILVTKTYLENQKPAPVAVFDLQTGAMLYNGQISGAFGTIENTDAVYFDRIVFEP